MRFFRPELADPVGLTFRLCTLQQRLGRSTLQSGLTSRPVVNHLMPPVVRHLLPSANFIEGPQASHAQPRLAVEGADIEAW